MTKSDYAKIYASIEKHLNDVIESYYIDPKEFENTSKVFISKDQFIRMVIARVDRDESLPDPVSLSDKEVNHE